VCSLEALTLKHKHKQEEFSHEFQEKLKSFIAAQLLCSDKATFYLSNKVNHNNICVWGFKNFHQVTISEQNSPKVNMFCAISHHKINGPCFFEEKFINGNIYLPGRVN
jgi:hypothetical protein